MAIRDLLPDVWRGERRAVNPIREMTRLQRNIDRMFDRFFSEPSLSLFRPMDELLTLDEDLEFVPARDVEETSTHLLMSFDLPGVKKEDVKIELQDHQLIVSGERKRQHKAEGGGRLTRERYYGAFYRSFMLPANVDPDKITANFENGVLQIAVPKAQVSGGKQIPIKEGKLIESKTGKAA